MIVPLESDLSTEWLKNIKIVFVLVNVTVIKNKRRGNVIAHEKDSIA